MLDSLKKIIKYFSEESKKEEHISDSGEVDELMYKILMLSKIN